MRRDKFIDIDVKPVKVKVLPKKGDGGYFVKVLKNKEDFVFIVKIVLASVFVLMIFIIFLGNYL